MPTENLQNQSKQELLEIIDGQLDWMQNQGVSSTVLLEQATQYLGSIISMHKQYKRVWRERGEKVE